MMLSAATVHGTSIVQLQKPQSMLIKGVICSIISQKINLEQKMWYSINIISFIPLHRVSVLWEFLSFTKDDSWNRYCYINFGRRQSMLLNNSWKGMFRVQLFFTLHEKTGYESNNGLIQVTELTSRESHNLGVQSPISILFTISDRYIVSLNI